MGHNAIFGPFQQQNDHVPRMSQSFIASQTKELFKCYQYMFKYFIILNDKMVQASTTLPRFHSSGTNLCSLSESPCNDYVAMVIKCQYT